MEIRVLGCSGGIGGPARTSAFLLDGRILLDAGTGVAELTLAELALIDHVFLTHAHFDHIACLPMLLDSVMSLRDTPVHVHALPETIDALRQHVFNWHIWPDFTLIPDEARPMLMFQTIREGESHQIGPLQIRALPAHHTVPALAYSMDDGLNAVVYSGDTIGGTAFWSAVNAQPNLAGLIIETAFPERELQLAQRSRHLCPSLLQRELSQLSSSPQIFITHLKPADAELIMREILASGMPVRELQQGEVLRF
jgi:3',5'-cyclic-nucleotide phosphodiesterase